MSDGLYIQVSYIFHCVSVKKKNAWSFHRTTCLHVCIFSSDLSYQVESRRRRVTLHISGTGEEEALHGWAILHLFVFVLFTNGFEYIRCFVLL